MESRDPGGISRDLRKHPSSIIHKEDHSTPSKKLVLSSSSASEFSQEDHFQLGANATSKHPKFDHESGVIRPLEPNANQTSLVLETGHGSRTTGSNTNGTPYPALRVRAHPSLTESLSRSSSSTSESSSEDSFYLDTNAIGKSPARSASPMKLHNVNGIRPEFNIPAEANFSPPKLNLTLSLSSMSSSVSESPPRDSFHLGADATSKSSTGTTNLPKLDLKVHSVVVKRPPDTSSPSKPGDNDDIIIGLLGHESNRTSSVAEYEHGSKTNGDLGTHPCPNKKLESSPSSSSSEDPFELSPKAISKSPAGSIGSCSGPGSPNLDKETQLGSSPPVTSGRHSRVASSPPATEIPPVQMMERQDDGANHAPYRIPSYVFTRTKSAAPTDWSMNSNESLFSIHMGNMSFTKEQFHLMSKSGELCKPGDIPFSGPLIDLASYQTSPPTPTHSKSNNICQPDISFDESSGVTEETAAETMREVIRESAENQSHDKESPPSPPEAVSPSLPEGMSHSPSLSLPSDGKRKSFAFPILTGDADNRSALLKIGSEKHKKKPVSQQLTPKETTPSAVQTPKSPSHVAHCRWPSCFSCCPLCS